MHKVSRTLLLAGVLAFGTLTAACGDKVTVAGPTPAVVGVSSIVVTPTSASIQPGATNAIQLAVSVVADASTAKTVTWTTSNAGVATVSAAGLVTGVNPGTVTITATSTADATKAAAAVITVGNPTQSTVNTVAISSVTAGGLGLPVNLNGVAGQIDVTLFISGPGGNLNLIQNCSATPNTSAGDVIVATQQVAGSQNQSPVTLSYNTAATGTITAGTPGTAVVNNTVNTPLFLNGPCVIKATLGTATAANTTPITLANANFFRPTISWSGPTQINNTATSAGYGLAYTSGTATVTLVPVNYVSATPLANVSGTFAGRPFQILGGTAANQSFQQTFNGVVVPQGTALAGTDISNYTSPVGGDNLVITATQTVAGQPGAAAFNGTVGGPGFPFRVDNGAPAAPTLAVINTTTNFLNAAYAFAPSASTYVSGADAGVSGDTFVFAAAPSTVAGLAGNTNYAGVVAGQGIGATQCSTTGWTTVATGNDLANSLAGVSNQYRVRVFETDKLGNVRCSDLTSPAGLANTTGFFGIDKQAPTIVKTAGPATNTVIVTGTTNSYAFQDSISGFVLSRQVQYQLYRGFVVAKANCVPIIDGVNATQNATANTSNSTCTGTALSAPNVIIDGNTGTQGYYNLTASSVDQAGNSSPALSYVYLLDNTAPVVQGISIPQNLVGGGPVTFTSTATDNVDLASTNFNITYSAATAGANLFYPGQTYGTKYTAGGVITTTPVNATVPVFIQQLQATTGGNAPVALVAADSGEAQAVTVRAIDAANNISVASTAAIPNINISSVAGFLGTTDLTTFQETNAAVALSNGNGSGARTATLSATAILLSGGAQSANVPFTQVCFFYQQTAAGAVADPTIPALSWVQVGCVSAPSITDVAGVSRTWTYQLAGFDPPAALGTAGTAVPLAAVGIKTGGVGLLSQANNNVTVVP